MIKKAAYCKRYLRLRYAAFSLFVPSPCVEYGWEHGANGFASGLAMYDRITSDSAILGGKPIIRGTRLSVEFILELIASGASRGDILNKHPHLTADDVEQALGYAAAAVRNEILTSAEVPS